MNLHSYSRKQNLGHFGFGSRVLIDKIILSYLMMKLITIQKTFMNISDMILTTKNNSILFKNLQTTLIYKLNYHSHRFIKK